MPSTPTPPRIDSDAPNVSGESIAKRGRRALSARAKQGGEPKREGRSTRAVSIAVALHIAIGIACLQLLTFGHGLAGFLGLGKSTEPREERISYVTPRAPTVVASTPTPTPPKPAAQTPPRLQAPSETPTVGVPVETPPAVSTTPTRADTGGSGSSVGNGVGALDPNLRGVMPGYTDARIWRGPIGSGGAPAPGRNGSQRLDSIISFAISSAADSLDAIARAQGRYAKAPGDWTKTDKNGDKWGWDGKGIRLGKVVIPNALLALLPLNAQVAMSGNPTATDRDKRLSLAREDIMRMADRTLGEQDFRKLVTELRERREKERRDRLRAPDASTVVAKPQGN